MADLLIRNLNPTVIKQLKLRAKEHNRSLQSELKIIVESAVKMSIDEVIETSEKWHKRLADQTFEDSAKRLRKDRSR